MISNKKIRILTTHWDRCSRSGIVRIGNKDSIFPSMAPTLKTDKDLRVYMDTLHFHPFESSHTKMMVLRLPEYEKTMESLVNDIHTPQQNLHGVSPFESEKHIFETTPLLIDPCMEYTRYKHHWKDLLQIPEMPKELKQLFRTLIDTDEHESNLEKIHGRFWNDLLESGRLRDVVKGLLLLQDKLGADIGLPPVPVTNNVKLFEITKIINEISKEYWGGENCATYVLLHQSVLKSDEMLNHILNYLVTADTKFIVIKIKNLAINQDHTEELEAFKKILETVNRIKRSSDKVFVMLEVGYQFYPALAGGFDFVSTSLRAFDADGVGFDRASHGMGGWYYKKELTIRRFPAVKKMFEKNGGLPCRCPACINMKKIPRQKEWNKKRREHFIYTASSLAEELSIYVANQKMELAMQTLSKSALNNFKRVLPFMN